jgi:hypothetical protein
VTPEFVTRFLTGDLVGILILSAVLTWPVSWALLALYRRAVHRSMRRSGGAAPETGDGEFPITRAQWNIADSGSAEELHSQLRRRPWRAALVYVAAALTYGATLALLTAWFADPEAPFRPVRLLLLTTSFAWPIVVTIGIVAASTRRRKVLVGMVYTTSFIALVGLAVSISSTTSASQLLLLWALHNGPSTALLALCLSPRIRAVGPLVLLFLVLGFVGSELLLLVTSSSDVLLRASVDVGSSLGLGGIATFWGIVASGFVAFGVVGAALLFWIRRRYARKQTSDESLTIFTIWWLFVFGHAIELAFEHPLAPLGGVLAMVLFIGVMRIGFARFIDHPGSGHTLLLLRSFSLGPRGERFFDAFAKHWRRVGSIEMIAGFDLASRTIDPQEFLDFMTGKVSRLFIDRREALERRLREMDTHADRDGRFRVNEFFCYDDTWRMVLLALVGEADAVLMDLRGFSRQNAGCVYEIGELFRVFPIERIVFLVDGQTDAAFLDETFAHAAASARFTSPTDKPSIVSCPVLNDATLDAVLAAVAAAVSSPARRAA